LGLATFAGGGNSIEDANGDNVEEEDCIL